MTGQCPESCTRSNYWLSIVLATVISLLVHAGWSFMYQLPAAIPVTTEVCTDSSSAIKLQRSQVFPPALKKRLP